MILDLSPIRLIDVADASSKIVTQLQGARSVTAKVVDAAILAVSREAIEDTVTAELSAELEATLEMHSLMNGERSGNGVDPDDWDSQLDDAVADLFKDKLEPYMGPGIHEHTTDTRIHEPGELEAFARRVAKVVAERMTTDPDVVARIASIYDKEEIVAAGKQKPKDDGFKAVVVIVLTDYLAKNPEDGLLDMLDLAADDEPILAAGPLEAIAKSYANKEEIARCLRVWKAQSHDWRNEAITAARQGLQPASVPSVALKGPDGAGEAPAAAEKPAKKTRKKKDATPAAETDEEREAREMAELTGELPSVSPLPALGPGVVVDPPPLTAAAGPVEVTNPGALTALRLLKEHGRITETDLAEKLGLSRSTINNMVREKIACDLGPEQRKSLASAIDEHLKGLASARAALGAV